MMARGVNPEIVRHRGGWGSQASFQRHYAAQHQAVPYEDVLEEVTDSCLAHQVAQPEHSAGKPRNIALGFSPPSTTKTSVEKPTKEGGREEVEEELGEKTPMLTGLGPNFIFLPYKFAAKVARRAASRALVVRADLAAAAALLAAAFPSATSPIAHRSCVTRPLLSHSPRSKRPVGDTVCNARHTGRRWESRRTATRPPPDPPRLRLRCRSRRRLRRTPTCFVSRCLLLAPGDGRGP